VATTDYIDLKHYYEEADMAKRKKTYEYDDGNLDYNSIGDLCDPLHPTARNKARHRHIMDMMLDAGQLNIAFKIFAAYPYLQDEYSDRMARAVREEAARRLL
jgi:hypothetical protein